MSKISPNISKVHEIHPVGKRLNHMYQRYTEKCTEVDSFTACAYLCTAVDVYRLPSAPNASCTNWIYPILTTKHLDSADLSQG